MGPDSELPNEKIVRELPREKSIHGFVSAISFEEASERELQYQRSMKMMLMRPSVDNNILPASPNALKPNPVGMKRKATSPSHPQKALQAIQDQILLHGETADRQAPPCQLQSQQSSPQQPILWCSLCEVPCMNSYCLEQHRQGKKHKAKMEEVLDSKNSDSDKKQELWCQQCNIWCIDKLSLAQHQIGKKHAARLLKLKLPKPNLFGTQQLDIQCPSVEKTAGLWCNLCNIPCMTELNLEQHLQGKQHKAKMEEVGDSQNSGSQNSGKEKQKQVFWCLECNIWCINEMALAQHQRGKKHALRHLELKGLLSSPDPHP